MNTQKALIVLCGVTGAQLMWNGSSFEKMPTALSEDNFYYDEDIEPAFEAAKAHADRMYSESDWVVNSSDVSIEDWSSDLVNEDEE